MNKINKSIKLFKEAKLHIPGGVNSPVRAFKNINGNPIFFKKAKGSKLFDEDNNEYIDYIGSWGPMIMGHSHPKIIKAISKQVKLGTSYGAPTSIESETAKLIKKCMPSIEKIRMVNSGTEATMSAIRLARGFTNKNKIIKFDGCYHGHADSLLIKAGSGVSTFGLRNSAGVLPQLAEETISCEFNNSKDFIEIFKKVKNDLAAVIIEPIAGNMGFIPGEASFLELIRKETAKNKSLLIFDEVMTGFRVSLGGAQEIYGIKPDLTTLGKIIGGGLPVGAFGGRKDVMDYLAPNGPVYQAGTLSGNPLAMSAGSTLIKLLIKDNPYKNLESRSKFLLEEMRGLFLEKNINLSTNQIGGMFGFFFSKELPNDLNDSISTNDKQFESFINQCIKNGIYFAPSKFEAGFISTKHTDKDINNTITIIKKILKEGI
mgnify:FL=1